MINAQHDELRDMIKALHLTDIEVVLDRVYNHLRDASQQDIDPYVMINAYSQWISSSM